MTPTELAVFENAYDTYAAYIGLLSRKIFKEKKEDNPNIDLIKTLEKEIRFLYTEKGKLTTENKELINKALYVYAPILKLNFAGSCSEKTSSHKIEEDQFIYFVTLDNLHKPDTGLSFPFYNTFEEAIELQNRLTESSTIYKISQHLATSDGEQVTFDSNATIAQEGITEDSRQNQIEAGDDEDETAHPFCEPPASGLI